MISSSLQDIEAAALQLPTADRLHLAQRLLASLSEDDEILATWKEEAERRADAFERGEIDAVAVEAAIAQTRARIIRDAPA